MLLSEEQAFSPTNAPIQANASVIFFFIIISVLMSLKCIFVMFVAKLVLFFQITMFLKDVFSKNGRIVSPLKRQR